MLRGDSKNKKGFTLIELLVVIAIIGLLASIVAVAVNSAREKARNTRRVADLTNFQKAIELYYDDFGKYPKGGSGDTKWVSCRGAGDDGVTWTDIATALKSYLPKLPADPIGSCDPLVTSTYAYTYYSNETDYKVAAWGPGVSNNDELDCTGNYLTMKDPVTTGSRGGGRCVYSVYSPGASGN